MSALSVIYVRKMVNYTRSLDNSRLITYATNKYRGDLGYDYIDVISINAYMGWYTAEIDDFGKILDDVHKYNPNKPVLISEFGAGAILGKRGEGKFTEDFQVTFLHSYWSQIEERMSGSSTNTGYVIGAAWWVFADFKSPRRIHSQISKYNLKGVVDQLRQPKLAYFEITTLFSTTPDNSKTLRSALLFKGDTLLELSRQYSCFKNSQTQYSRIHILEKHLIYTSMDSSNKYRLIFDFLKTTFETIAFKNIE